MYLRSNPLIGIIVLIITIWAGYYIYIYWMEILLSIMFLAFVFAYFKEGDNDQISSSQEYDHFKTQLSKNVPSPTPKKRNIVPKPVSAPQKKQNTESIIAKKTDELDKLQKEINELERIVNTKIQQSETCSALVKEYDQKARAISAEGSHARSSLRYNKAVLQSNEYVSAARESRNEAFRLNAEIEQKVQNHNKIIDYINNLAS